VLISTLTPKVIDIILYAIPAKNANRACSAFCVCLDMFPKIEPQLTQAHLVLSNACLRIEFELEYTTLLFSNTLQ
jgi:hypothetical protein